MQFSHSGWVGIRQRRRLVYCLGVLLLLVGALAPENGLAATLTVTSGSDSGPGTLRRTKADSN